MASNINEVIDRLKRAQKRIPVEIGKALAADQWLESFIDVARMALTGAAVNDGEIEAIPGLLESIKTSGALRVEISAVSTQSLSEKDNPKVPRKELLEWVQGQKHKRKEKDYFKTDRSKLGYAKGEQYPDEWIASRVMHAILKDPDPWLKSADDTGLKAFLNLQALPPESIHRLLMAVNRSWLDFVKLAVPGTIGGAIRKSFE